MELFPSEVRQGPPDLAERFPTRLPIPEQLIYERIKAATDTGDVVFGRAMLLDPRPAGGLIEVVRGWPAYPGTLPAIGVASGPETEDQGADLGASQFAGTAYDYGDLTFPADGSGIVLLDSTRMEDPERRASATPYGVADYYAEPLYSTVVVELVHENRDERDRLHNQLRRILFPLRRTLVTPFTQVRRIRVDAERQEATAGPDTSEEPFVAYVSLFTLHFYYEMLEASDVRGEDAIPARFDVDVSVTDTGS